MPLASDRLGAMATQLLDAAPDPQDDEIVYEIRPCCLNSLALRIGGWVRACRAARLARQKRGSNDGHACSEMETERLFGFHDAVSSILMTVALATTGLVVLEPEDVCEVVESSNCFNFGYFHHGCTIVESPLNGWTPWWSPDSSMRCSNETMGCREHSVACGRDFGRSAAVVERNDVPK